MTSTVQFPPKKLDRTAPCLLCGSTAGRVESHVIPALVTRAMRKSSASGHLRLSATPNRRVQDPFKDHLLCEECEGRFGSWEGQFAELVFHPHMAGERRVLRYGPWLHLFATSLTWRALAWHREHSELPHQKIHDWSVTDAPFERWRDYLLGRAPHPGPYEQHVLRFDYITGVPGRDVPPNLNRHLMRSCTFEVMSNGSVDFVYSKLCGFMFIGLGRRGSEYTWRGTRLGFRGGVIWDRDTQIPGFIYDDVIEPKANIEFQSYAAMSTKQKDRVEETMRQDMDRAASSGTMAALDHDVKLFGEKAFAAPKDE